MSSCVVNFNLHSIIFLEFFKSTNNNHVHVCTVHTARILRFPRCHRGQIWYWNIEPYIPSLKCL